MTVAEYLPAALAAATGDVPVRAVRFENERESSGPSVMYRKIGRAGGVPMFDIQTGGGVQAFEIECHAPTCEGAQQMAADILERLQRDGRLNAINQQYDEPDDPSQERGRYFSHIVEVEILS